MAVKNATMRLIEGDTQRLASVVVVSIVVESRHPFSVSDEAKRLHRTWYVLEEAKIRP